ncbi:MAG: cysteine dioxygenase family protein [Bacteroidota bacterium]
MNFYEKVKGIEQCYTEAKEQIKGPADFKAILQKFDFNSDDMTDHLLYPEDLPYGRKCAYRSSNFEVIVMNWKPGKSSNIHDHGDSFGCVYSVSGKADNVLYNPNLEQVGIIPLVNHTIAEVPQGIYHAIENNSETFAVSLHFYVPPMNGMKVIDKEDKTKSYIVKNECGAWNPDKGDLLTS